MGSLVQQGREAVVSDIFKHLLKHPSPISHWLVVIAKQHTSPPSSSGLVRCCESSIEARQVKSFFQHEGMRVDGDDSLESPLVCVFHIDEGTTD